MSDFQSAIDQARAGQDLTTEQTSELIDAMLRGEPSDDQVGQLLLSLREKGEAVSELIGAAEAMRRHMRRINHHHGRLLDTCGTGGSGSGTFNISTTVAIVAAAAGVPVAKHGNRKATSRSGSADVLEILGVKLESEPEAVAERLDSIGICFCFAAKLHPAMRHVADIRRKLAVPTLFNLLGPLCNPAAATHQLLGTSSLLAQQKIAAAAGGLNTTRAFIVHAEDGQDEVSLAGVTRVLDVTRRGQVEQTWTADSFGLPATGHDSLAAANPQESAEIIQRIFAGEPGPCRDTVLAGTAAALLLVGEVDDVRAGVAMAAEALDSGAAKAKLAALCT